MFPVTYADPVIFVSVILGFAHYIYPKLEELERIEKSFFLVSLPYLIVIAIISAQAAKGTLATQNIFFTIGISLLYLKKTSKKLGAGIDQYKFELIVGVSTLLFFIIRLETISPGISLDVLALTAVISIIPITLLLLIFDKRIYATLPVLSHFFDAASTVIAIENGLVESNLLAKQFISLIGPYGIFMMKFLIIIPAVVYSLELEENYSKISLYIIFALGFILGIRNILLI